MKNKTIKEIKMILNEFHGVQSDIKTLSRGLVNGVEKTINYNLEKINDGNIWDLIYQVNISDDDVVNRLGFSFITINIEYKNSKGKNTGVFESNKIKLLDNGFYSVVIKLKVLNNNLLGLEDIISHELNHAFVDIKNIGGSDKLKKTNRARSITKTEVNKYIEEFPELDKFLKMVYLSNPIEIQARVQETGNRVEISNKKNAEETIEYLLRFQPLSDARNMISYSTDDIKKIDKNILEDFIRIFNKNFKKNLDNKTKSNIDSFFDYWQKIINKRGGDLAMKIYKIVSDKFMINEIDLYNHNSFSWVFNSVSFDRWLYD